MTREELYHKLVSDLENAINDLDAEIFHDRQTTGRVEYWKAHDHCKALSYYKSQIIDELEKAGMLKY